MPHAPSRIAVLGEGFRPAKNVRVFDPGDRALLVEYRPEAIVAPLAVALRLFNVRFADLAAVIVVTSVDRPMDERDRDRLWERFGVPVFEQLRGADGRIIGRECEAHDGLHLAGEDTGGDLPLPAEMVMDECDCGSEAPRIRILAEAASA